MYYFPTLASSFEPANWFLTKTADANVEPIDLATAKLHLKQDANTDDILITSLITAARETCEAYTNRIIGTQAFTQTQDGFSPVPIPYPTWFAAFHLYVSNLQTVNSITYIDPDGATQTWSNTAYDVIKVPNGWSYIRPVFGTYYPVTRWEAASVNIALTAGGPATQSMIAGMLLLIGHWYENREAVIHSRFAVELPWAVEALWQPARIF